MKKRIVISLIKHLIKYYDKNINSITVSRSFFRSQAKNSKFMSTNNAVNKLEKDYNKRLKKYRRYKITLIEILNDYKEDI